MEFKGSSTDWAEQGRDKGYGTEFCSLHPELLEECNVRADPATRSAIKVISAASSEDRFCLVTVLYSSPVMHRYKGEARP